MHMVQVQAYMLESLFLKLPAGAQACLTVPCVLEDVMPAFCQGVCYACQLLRPFIATYVLAGILSATHLMVSMAASLILLAAASKAS